MSTTKDITIFASTRGSRLFPIYGPRHYIHAAGGGIGQGLQMALGTKLGQPEYQVVVMVGDGGLQVNMGELGTAVQAGIYVVIVLFNDSGYGILRTIQNRIYSERHIGVDLHGLNFKKLCEAYAIPHYPVTSATMFRPAIQTALESRHLSLVEVDMTQIGPFRQPFAGYALSNEYSFIANAYKFKKVTLRLAGACIHCVLEPKQGLPLPLYLSEIVGVVSATKELGATCHT